MHKISWITLPLSLLLFLTGCRKNQLNPAVGNGLVAADTMKYNADWTFASHGNSVPDYTTVFPDDQLNTLEISMTAAQWTSIRSNMKTLYGTDFGTGGQGGMPPGAGATTGEPAYLDVTLKFRNKTWKHVGFRLKGNSTLRTAWSSGNYKLPFRLNFDEFEDKYPAITNQHFNGFEEMSFSPGAKDPSLIHEKLAAEVFRQAGIAAARCGFYKVFIDFGVGLKYCGVYTGLEIPDDNMIKSQFGEESGNTYKPESNFTVFNQSLFEKKNNTTTPDYSDVTAFVAALNNPIRTTDAQTWRTQLESVFNMDHFLKYLAVNNAIVNWDSYGVMAHNYYLYNHSIKKLTWIPWDHNEAFAGSPGITGTSGNTGGPGAPGGNMNAVSLSMNEVGVNWPMLRYVANDPIYFSRYKAYMKSFKDNIFTEANMNGLIDKYQQLISSSVIGANGEKPQYSYITNENTFTSSFQTLKTHVTARRNLISTFAQ
jgi:spore coat protein CotH